MGRAVLLKQEPSRRTAIEQNQHCCLDCSVVHVHLFADHGALKRKLFAQRP